MAEFSAVQKKLITYLGSGCKQAEAAAAVGVSEGYVSQLMKDGVEFRNAVSAVSGKQLDTYVKMDTLADSVQLTALERLEKAVTFGMKPETLLRTISVLDSMKRRSVSGTREDSINNGLVRISLPATLNRTVAIAVDKNNTVIQIGENTMVPATSSMLDIMAEGVEVFDHEPRTEIKVLPGTATEVATGAEGAVLSALSRTGVGKAGSAAGEDKCNDLMQAL